MIASGQNEWLRLRPTSALGELVLAGLVSVMAIGALFGPGDHMHSRATGTGIALVLVGTLPLLIRRVYPQTVLAIAVLSEILILLSNSPSGVGSGFGMAVALYTVATRDERRRSLQLAAGIAMAQAILIGVESVAGRSSGLTVVIGLTFLVVGSWSLGDNVRTRRAYLAQLEDRAQRLELEREENARRAVQEERARIARELHDVIAHHVSAISVQAGAAAEIAESNPTRARDSLHAIQSTSRQALSEMRAMLNVLRSDDEIGSERDPQPSLAQMERLVAQSEAAGLPVTLSIEGPLLPVPEALDLSAYRIVQEALTNTLKHAGPAHARVVVRFSADRLELEITDDGVGPPTQPIQMSAGRGLIGMRERVALFGGELITGGLDRPGFTVRARLPLRST